MTVRHVLIGIIILLAALLGGIALDAFLETTETGQIESHGDKSAE
jgi:hypothetical protein